MADHVDLVMAQWRVERPSLDVSPMGVIGRLSIASRLVEQQLRGVFAAHELDGPSFDVLATLLRSGPPYRLTPGQLSRSAMVTSGAITQRLDRLQERGLIMRAPSEQDGRGVDVTLTSAGYELVDAALPDHVHNEHRILAGLSRDDREQLAAILSRLIATLDTE